MNKPLKKFAAYSGERIPLDEIDVDTYITTNNLLQNKKGKVAAEKLPKQVAGNVTRFEKGDILIGNIRPYLKKIWLAKYTGGSSADVLTLKVEDRFDSSFIYYALFRDEFFEHMMNGSKGTKMPRGDKNQILDFPIPNFDKQTQVNISKVLSAFDAKIELNNKIRSKLEDMAKLIYDYWFVQFDFPDKNGKPYKSSGGKMVCNDELKRAIPEGWEVVELKDCLNSNRGVSYSSKDIDGEGIPMINLNSFNIDSTYKPAGIKSFSGIYNDSKVLKPLDIVMCNTQQTAINPKTDIIGKSFLIPDIFQGEIVSSHHVTTIKVEKDNLKYYLNTLFNTEYFHRYISGYTIGTNIMGLDFSGVLTYKTEIPNDELLNKYKSIIVNVEKQKSIAIKENQKLSELRDWLLPMLMNGQVTVGNSYEQEEEKLGMATEPGAAYQNDKEAIDALFETINHDYETAVIQLLTERRFGFTYGKKYTHKMFSNIQMLYTMPKFKDLVFEEKGWGMFSKAVAKTIDAQKFIYFHRLDHGATVLKAKQASIKVITDWMAQSENKDFVSQVNYMLNIYEKPLINKDMDRIELFNTVLECMKVLETDNLQEIRLKMANWKMEEDHNKTKAEKFSENETLHMIQFVKELIE